MLPEFGPFELPEPEPEPELGEPVGVALPLLPLPLPALELPLGELGDAALEEPGGAAAATLETFAHAAAEFVWALPSW